MTEFPGKGKVAVLKTSPETVLEDIQSLMKLAGFRTGSAQIKPHRSQDKYFLANLVSGLFIYSLAD